MTHVRAVIGANYGDEGKGRTVDWLCRYNSDDWIPSDARLVVRFNGGGQAGHTVVDGDKRHVFSHVGSGALAGSPTHLSKFFIFNPIILMGELKNIRILTGGYPRISADPSCLITTPFDMAMNQSLEELRGDKRHGSCGAGVGETVRRALDWEDRIYLREIVEAEKKQDWTTVHRKMKFREDQLVNFREANGLEPLDVNGMNHEFITACVDMSLYVVPMRDVSRLNSVGMVIFEGAQGLMLDQTFGDFPHVTRSDTGIRNVMQLVRSCDLPDPQFHYLSRGYMTRHGDGPLERECSFLDLGLKDADKTNVWNKFQSHLRYAPLNVPKLIDRIYGDLNRNIRLTDQHIVYLHMSHLDESKDYEGWMVGTNNDMIKKPSPLWNARNVVVDRKAWGRSPETWKFVAWHGPSAKDATVTGVDA